MYCVECDRYYFAQENVIGREENYDGTEVINSGFTCVLCEEMISGCKRCDNAVTCTQCMSGYPPNLLGNC